MKKKTILLIASSIIFFISYKYLMNYILWQGRSIPPINDILNYTTRVQTVINNTYQNDNTFFYTYPLGFLGKLFKLSAFTTIKYSYYLGPLLAAWVLFTYLKPIFKNNYLTALFFFLISFYAAGIGFHSFTHFVPSFYLVLLSFVFLQYLFSYYFKISLKKIIILLVIITVSLNIHGAGFYMLITQGIIFSILIFLKEKKKINFKKIALLFLLIFIIQKIQLFSTPAYKNLLNNYSNETLKLKGPLTPLFSYIKIILTQKHYIAFFKYFWPNPYLGSLIVLTLIGLIFFSLKKPSSLIKKPIIFVPPLVWFFLFLIIPFFKERANRIVEFLFPYFIIFLTVLFYDFLKTQKKYITLGGSLFIFSLGLLMSGSFALEENIQYKKVKPIPKHIVSYLKKEKKEIISNHSFFFNYLKLHFLIRTKKTSSHFSIQKLFFQESKNIIDNLAQVTNKSKYMVIVFNPNYERETYRFKKILKKILIKMDILKSNTHNALSKNKIKDPKKILFEIKTEKMKLIYKNKTFSIYHL